MRITGVMSYSSGLITVHSSTVLTVNFTQVYRLFRKECRRSKRMKKSYHSVTCLVLELGRKDLFPDMLGFNSPTVTTPISSNPDNSAFTR